MSKTKNLTHANMINKVTNLSKCKTPAEHRFEVALQDLDLQQSVYRYKWKNTDDIPSWLIENMLYYRATLTGFYRGGQLYILPYSMQGGINLYGMPVELIPISYNGVNAGGEPTQAQLKLEMDKYGKHKPNVDCALLFDRAPFGSASTSPVPRFILNKTFVEFEAELLQRVKDNIQASSVKTVFYVKNPKQRELLSRDIENALGSGQGYVVLIRDAMETGDGTPFQSNIDMQTQELFECYQSVNSIRCGLLGITNGGAFEKKERVVTSELDGDMVQSDIVIDSGLIMRKLFCEQMRKIYPECKIDVELNESVGEPDLPEDTKDPESEVLADD